MATSAPQEEESHFIAVEIDPLVREIQGETEPWAAYRQAIQLLGRLSEPQAPLKRGGELYVAWAELTDLFETDRTPIPDAHKVLRAAAQAFAPFCTALLRVRKRAP